MCVLAVLCFSQVQAPIAVPAAEPKSKTECYGVFCLTYDLRAVSSLIINYICKIYNINMFIYIYMYVFV